ncbi:MAG: hypothetical protein IPM01_24440 [Burkholderiaceae bacterium]|nr:hypothetical protein [Burkholderiaceae bacterium]
MARCCRSARCRWLASLAMTVPRRWTTSSTHLAVVNWIQPAVVWMVSTGPGVPPRESTRQASCSVLPSWARTWSTITRSASPTAVAARTPPVRFGAALTGDSAPPSNASINGTQVFWVNTDGGNPNREKTDMILYNRTFFQNVNGQGAGSGPSVECASCHDPHVSEGASAANGQVAGATFLRISNAGSAVCLACHVK